MLDVCCLRRRIGDGSVTDRHGPRIIGGTIERWTAGGATIVGWEGAHQGAGRRTSLRLKTVARSEHQPQDASVTVDPIGFVTILLGMLGLFYGIGFSINVFIPSTLLGSASAILFSGAGQIQPAHQLLGFLAPAIMIKPSNWQLAAARTRFPKEGFWLALFVAYCVVGAIFFPRILAGITSVNAIGTTDYGPAILRVPLGPTSGNVTQSIYLMGDFGCFLLVSILCQDRDGMRRIGRGMVIYCYANILFAILDLATFWTNTPFLLDPIRNASYDFHIDTVISGLKRIVGSFTETSAFSYATVGAAAYALRLWLSGYRSRESLALGIVSIGLLLFSTSSTAIVATPAVLVLIYAQCAFGLGRGRLNGPTIVFLVFVPLLVGSLVLGVMLNTELRNTVGDMLNMLVFDKSSSQSGIERGQWNTTALQNLKDTYGLGGGLGSIRSSSFVVALLASTGLFGTWVFLSFLYKLFTKTDRSTEAELRAFGQAARTACAGLLVTASISGALVDLGLPFYIFAALACASPRALRTSQPGGQSLAVLGGQGLVGLPSHEAARGRAPAVVDGGLA